MYSSRDTILAAVRKARRIPSQLPVTPAGTDRIISKKLDSITPKTRKGLVKQFQTELQQVSGEFLAVKDVGQAAKMIAKILQENGVQTLAMDGGKYSAKIAQKLAKIKIVDASRLDYAKRLQQIEPVKAAVIDASHGVADAATLAIPLSDTKSLLPHILTDILFAVLRPDRIVPNLFELFKVVPAAKLKNMVLITGPSRTADIEKIIILGAHGPKRLIVLLLKEGGR